MNIGFFVACFWWYEKIDPHHPESATERPFGWFLENPNHLPCWAAISLGDPNHTEDDKPEIGTGSGDEFDTDDDQDDEDQTKIKKMVGFPPEVERGDVQPSSLVNKVNRAIQKRLDRLALHKDSLEKLPTKNEVQTKFPS